MKYHYPAYYSRFSCLGAACGDTCCAGWQIGIDEASFRAYQKVPGPFGKRLRRGIDSERRIFRLPNRRCALLDADGLCAIYRELGKDMLCRTCRVYPRHVEDFGDLREVTLSLSCPEAARLILEDEENGAFLIKERPGHGEPLENPELLSALLDVRQTMVCILKNRSIGWDERLAMLLAYTHDVQRRLGRPELSGLSARYLSPGAPARFERRLGNFRNRKLEQMIRCAALMRTAAGLEPVVEGWRKEQEQLCHRLYHKKDMEAHASERSAYYAQLPEYEKEWENLILYFVETFVLGAVYDGDVFGKGKMILFSYLMIREHCLAERIKKGGMDREILVRAACRYSREVENSDANLELLERELAHNRLFGMDSMLVMLLGAQEGWDSYEV